MGIIRSPNGAKKIRKNIIKSQGSKGEERWKEKILLKN
jgi:hypothetical protein